MHAKQIAFLRNFVFGVEDSLVSTVGLLSGIAAAGQSAHTIVLAGIVLIFVEAFSMGVGSLLSDNSAKEFQSGIEEPLGKSLRGSLTMFVSYFVSGFIPLAPYLLLKGAFAFPASIGVSMLALFALGWITGKVSKISPFRQGLQMCTIGGAAILLGVVVGTLVSG